MIYLFADARADRKPRNLIKQANFPCNSSLLNDEDFHYVYANHAMDSSALDGGRCSENPPRSRECVYKMTQRAGEYAGIIMTIIIIINFSEREKVDLSLLSAAAAAAIA